MSIEEDFADISYVVIFVFYWSNIWVQLICEYTNYGYHFYMLAFLNIVCIA